MYPITRTDTVGTATETCTLFGVVLKRIKTFQPMMDVEDGRSFLRHGDDMSRAGSVFASTLHLPTPIAEDVLLPVMTIRKQYDGYIPSHGILVARTHEFSYERTHYFPDDATMDAEVALAWGSGRVTDVRRREAALLNAVRNESYQTVCADVGLVEAGHCHLHDEFQEVALRVRNPRLLGIGHFGEVVFSLGFGRHTVKQALGFLLSLRATAYRPARWTEVELHCLAGYGGRVGRDTRRLVLADVRDLLGFGKIQALWASITRDCSRVNHWQDVLAELRHRNMHDFADRLELGQGHGARSMTRTLFHVFKEGI